MTTTDDTSTDQGSTGTADPLITQNSSSSSSTARRATSTTASSRSGSSATPTTSSTGCRAGTTTTCSPRTRSATSRSSTTPTRAAWRTGSSGSAPSARSATSIPEPRTSHNISNVEVIEQRGDLVDVRFNWHTMYFRYKTIDPYYGTTFYTIDFSGAVAAHPAQDRGAQERLHPPRRRHLPLLRRRCDDRDQTPSPSPSRTASPASSQCREDQTVADASYRSRINIPLDCRDGACGTCKALLRVGRVRRRRLHRGRAHRPTRRPPGYVLPCSMKPRSDLVLQIASTSAVAKTRAATYTATIAGAGPALADDDVAHAGHPTATSWPSCPGSTSTSPSRAPTRPGPTPSATPPTTSSSSFLVKLTPGGVMSTWLAERAAVGDEVSSPGPTAASSSARPSGRCCCSPAAPGWRRSCRSCAGCGRPGAPGRRTWSTASAPTTTSSSSTSSASSRRRLPGSRGTTASPTRAAPRQQGLRHEPDRAGAPARRRRRGLPVRPAADGGGGAHALRRRRRRADRLLLREVRPLRRRPRRRTRAGPRRRRPSRPHGARGVADDDPRRAAERA